MKQSALRSILHSFKRYVIILLKFLLNFIPKDNNLILVSAWFGKKYIDSPKFIYEYLIEKTNYDVYWYTKDFKLFQSLKNENKPVVYAYSLYAIWKQIRAKMLISSIQLYDFNPYFLSNCIYFDLGHGFPIKQSGFEQSDVTDKFINFELLLRKNIKYYMSASSDWTMKIMARCFRLSPEQFVFSNKPRIDVFFKEDLRNSKNDLLHKLKSGRKCILYMPTHRSCGTTKMHISEIIDLKAVQEICEQYNSIFLIKKHFYHRNEIEQLDQYSRIFDISNENIDSQLLLFEADILISDYSASYIDYLILNRPIVFFAYDYDNFIRNERDMYLKFDDIDAGFKAVDKLQLNKTLSILCSNNFDDVFHEQGRLTIKKMYFNDEIEIGNSIETVANQIKALLDGTFVPRWRVNKNENTPTAQGATQFEGRPLHGTAVVRMQD